MFLVGWNVVVVVSVVFSVASCVYMFSRHRDLHFPMFICSRLCVVLFLLFCEHLVVPSDGLIVRACRECIAGNLPGKGFAGFRVHKREDPGGFLQIWNMLLGVKEKLDGLPYYETAGCKRGDRRRDKIVVWSRLQRV